MDGGFSDVSVATTVKSIRMVAVLVSKKSAM
jgi:hypothetical protein